MVDPVEVIEKHGKDAFRYYFLRHIDTFADSSFNWENFENAYNNELADDLGNLVQRLATLAAKNEIILETDAELALDDKYQKLMDDFEFAKAFDLVWEKVQNLNKRIDLEKPWSLAKLGETKKLEECLRGLVHDLLSINLMLSPFLPETTEKIAEIFTHEIKLPLSPLFPKQ